MLAGFLFYGVPVTEKRFCDVRFARTIYSAEMMRGYHYWWLGVVLVRFLSSLAHTAASEWFYNLIFCSLTFYGRNSWHLFSDTLQNKRLELSLEIIVSETILHKALSVNFLTITLITSLLREKCSQRNVDVCFGFSNMCVNEMMCEMATKWKRWEKVALYFMVMRIQSHR